MLIVNHLDIKNNLSNNMMDDTAHVKNEVISKIYNDPGGHGSIKETFQDAKKKDNTITLFDVKKWFESNTQRKQNLTGFNSYFAPKPFFEYQVDLFLLVIGILQMK